MHAFLIAAALLPVGTKPLGLPIQRHQAADITQVAVDLFRPYMRHDGMPIRWVVNREGVATQVRAIVPAEPPTDAEGREAACPRRHW